MLPLLENLPSAYRQLPSGIQLHSAGRASQNQRDGLKAVVSDAVLPLLPAVLEEEDPMPLYALKLLVVLLDTHPTWALQLQR